jgi:hypothetical protein
MNRSSWNFECFRNLTLIKLKTTLITLFLVLSLNSFCQSRIGIQIAKVRAEFSDPKYALKYMKHDSSAYISYQDKYANIIHRFGRDSICYKTYVMVTDTAVANEIASTYDQIYKPLSPLEWIVDTPTEALDVQLVEVPNKDGVPQRTFQWTRKNP